MPDFSMKQRKALSAKNQAMPDGGFPIRNISDLKNAIQAYGRATNKPAVKAWIKKRARELGAEDLLPDNWRTDIIKHYGVKGQKWGIRRYQNKDGSLTSAGMRRVKKDVKKAQKNTRRDKSGNHFEGSTGKNYDKVQRRGLSRYYNINKSYYNDAVKTEQIKDPGRYSAKRVQTEVTYLNRINRLSNWVVRESRRAKLKDIGMDDSQIKQVEDYMKKHKNVRI